MAVLKYKDGDGNLQPIVGLNVQNQVVQTTGQSTTAVMSQKAVSDLVPAQASSTNQLADKDFVNSSISTATATYQGSYNLVSDLSLTTQASHGQIETALNTAATGADNNDYAYVQIPTSDSTPTEIASVERYKFNGTRWSFEYALNNSGFTAAQWAAVNSGITSGLVAKLGQLTSNPQNSIAALFGMDASGNFQNITAANLASVLSAATPDQGIPAAKINRHVERVAFINPGEAIGLYGYINMKEASFVVVRGKDWGQSIVGISGNDKFQTLLKHNMYYDLNIDENGVITDTVYNVLYIVQII